MNTTLTSQPQKDYLFIESKDILETQEELSKHSMIIYQEIAKYKFQKILVSQPETQFPMDLFPYFGLVQDYVENFPPEIRTLKIALIIADEYKEIAASWESLCVSRGLQYHAFTSLEQGRKWLLE